MTYKIQLNKTATHSLEVTEENLKTIRKYALFKALVDSNGYVTDAEFDKLKYNIRSLISNCEENCKDLLDLCIDVIYHDKMKAFGLSQLMEVYKKWERTVEPEKEEIAEQPEKDK